MKAGRWGWLAALVAGSFAVHVVLLVNSAEVAALDQQTASGGMLAAQLADAAAPALLAHDMVSLSVLTSRLEDSQAIQGVAVSDPAGNVLAQFGADVAPQAGRHFTAPVTLNGRELGQVNLQLAAPGRAEIVRRNLANLTVSALLHLSLFGIAFALLVRRQPAAARPAPALRAEPAMAESGPEPVLPAARPAALLHLGLDDPNNLLTRVNATTADELLTVLDHLLDRAARLYGGEIVAPFSPAGTVVAFHQADPAERAFQAMLCGQLFLQLVAGADQQRRAAGLFSLPVKAGVYHAEDDTPDSHQTAAILALAAPSGRLLSSTGALAPDVLDRCHTGQSLCLALGAGRELPIVVIERLQAEYQQLVHNQTQQLLGLN